MLEVSDLAFQAGDHRVRDVSFQVDAGSVHVLLGPTGTGKTLLLEAIAGLRPVDRGRIRLDGRDSTRLPPEHRGLAYVPQDLALFPHLRVRDNVLFAARIRGRVDPPATTDALDLMERLGIAGLAERWPQALSGGERQRVALARALASGHRLLLLDEPFAALNESLRGELWMLLKDLQASLGLTILMVTHDLEEAFFLADHISVLIDGAIQQTGPKGRVYHRPGTVAVAQYLGIRNRFQGQVEAHRESLVEVRCPGLGQVLVAPAPDPDQGPLPAVGEAVTLAIRAEEVKVIRPEFIQAEPHNLLRGRIETLYDRGASHTLVFRLPQGDTQGVEIELSSPMLRKLGLARGSECAIALRPALINLLPSGHAPRGPSNTCEPAAASRQGGKGTVRW